MPVNLSIKNVPDALAEALRARAERNHRSLQGELMHIIQTAMAAEHTTPAPAAATVTIEDLYTRSKNLFPEGTPSSVAFIRAMRDGRNR
jgi:plasmid stability protein